MTTGRSQRPQSEIAEERARAASEALRADTSIPDILRFDTRTTDSCSLPIGKASPSAVAQAAEGPAERPEEAGNKARGAKRTKLTRYVFNEATDGGPFTNYALMVNNLSCFSDERTSATLAALGFYEDQTVGLLAARIGYTSGMRSPSDHARNYVKRIDDRLTANGLTKTERGSSLFDTLVTVSNQGRKLSVLAAALVSWSAADPVAEIGAVFGKSGKETPMDIKNRIQYLWEVAESGTDSHHRTPAEGTKARLTRDALLRLGFIRTDGVGRSRLTDDSSARAVTELADITSAFSQNAASLADHAEIVRRVMFANPSERTSRARMSLHDTVAKAKTNPGS